MRIPQLLLSACPECQGNLMLCCAQYEDADVEDPHVDAKMANLERKFSKTTLEQTVKALNWVWKTDAELKKLIFGRIVCEGQLTCEKCAKQYLVKNKLARFVDKE